MEGLIQLCFYCQDKAGDFLGHLGKRDDVG